MTSPRRLLADPVLHDFQVVRLPSWRALVRTGYEGRELSEILSCLDDGGEPAERVEGGRATHPVLTLASGERVVVRRYRRGGLLRHLNSRYYLAGHRAFHEARVTERARAGGVAVPRVVAALELPRWWGYEAALVTAWIPGVRESAAWLAGAPRGEHAAALQAAGAQIGRMHAAGVAHPDLNLRNVLVSTGPDADPRVYLIDFDRGRLFAAPVPEARRRRDLRRLARSARKLAAPVGERGWEALREGYGSGWPAGLRLG